MCLRSGLSDSRITLVPLGLGPEKSVRLRQQYCADFIVS